VSEPIAEEIPRRAWLRLVPLVVALVIGAFLFVGLGLRPKEIPSALIGKAAPEFDLPALPGRPKGLKTADLKGEVSLVNVFASWCVSCRAEHPLFMKLQASGVVPVHGLNNKDKGEAAMSWLNRYGDPYDRVGADLKGRVSIDWGVYGVPETFLVSAEGRIVCKHIGPVMQRDLEILLKAIEALRQGGICVVCCCYCVWPACPRRPFQSPLIRRLMTPARRPAPALFTSSCVVWSVKTNRLRIPMPRWPVISGFWCGRGSRPVIVMTRRLAISWSGTATGFFCGRR